MKLYLRHSRNQEAERSLRSRTVVGTEDPVRFSPVESLTDTQVVMSGTGLLKP